MLRLDRDVPIPISRSEKKRRHPEMYVMQVGESFFVPKPPDIDSVGHQKRIGGIARNATNMTGKTFAIYQRVENGVEGVRVWRRS